MFETLQSLKLYRVVYRLSEFKTLQSLKTYGKQSDNSKPCKRVVMPLIRFKFLSRCLRFNNWHNWEKNIIHNKFGAVAEIWGTFLIDFRRAYIPNQQQ